MAMALLAFASCSKEHYFYQLYEVESPDVQTLPGVMAYDNDDCLITYNLWSNSGNMNFVFYNKTDSELYLVMPKSFFILNNLASDYYNGNINTITVAQQNSAVNATGLSVGLSGYAYNHGSQWFPTAIQRLSAIAEISSNSVSYSLSVPDQEIICVPPRSAKYIKGFAISDYVHKVCGNDAYFINYPKKSSFVATYTNDETPLMIRNRLAYAFSSDGEGLKLIENTFFVKSVYNYNEKVFISKKKKDCEGNNVRYFNYYAPQRFYNRYLGRKNAFNDMEQVEYYSLFN